MGVYQKPGRVEAVQLRWATWTAVVAFVGNAISPASRGRMIPRAEASDTCGEAGPDFIAFDVTTTHGEKATVRHGDWIISDSKPGTFYPCKPDVFAKTYRPVDTFPTFEPITPTHRDSPLIGGDTVTEMIRRLRDAIRHEGLADLHEIAARLHSILEAADRLAAAVCSPAPPGPSMPHVDCPAPPVARRWGPQEGTGHPQYREVRGTQG